MDDLQNSTVPQPPEKPNGKPQTFACPACAGIIKIKAAGISISAACAHCSTIIDVVNDNYQIIKRAHENTRKTLLELGARGRLFGVEWEVIGYTKKKDSDSYGWEEYLLYNPYYGFRFLVQSNGHWNFFKVLKKDIPGAGVANKIWADGKKYNIFLKGNAIVDYVKGEFFWRVKKGERTRVTDYIAPPNMISTDENDQEMTISLGKYLNPGEVAEAFKLDTEMPNKTGVGANQPGPYQGKFTKIYVVMFVAIILATLIQLRTHKTADNATVYSSEFHIEAANKDKTISTPSFFLPKKENVLIQSEASMDNNWLELNLSLVNEQTNTPYNIAQVIEYYHGQDSDGYWSEGGRNTQTFISSVPSGNYRLLIDTDSGTLRNTPISFALRITRDAASWSNYWIIFLLLLIYPAFVLIRLWSFENGRWSESDYTPDIYKLRNDE